MTTSDVSWSRNFRKIGDLERPDHYHLRGDDECLFLGEYTARENHNFSRTNQIILNLKKSPLVRGTPQWKYKLKAIREVGSTLRQALKPDALPSLTFVPIPPSKMPDDNEYDDRITQICRIISPEGTREMIRTITTRDARHIQDYRRDVGELQATLQINEQAIEPHLTRIILIDDVITTGCSFKACKALLNERLPDVPVFGIFVARRAIPQQPNPLTTI